MRDWLKKLRRPNAGDESGIDPKSDLGKLLVGEAARLKPVGLDDAVRRWLLEGEGDAILGEIHTSPKARDCVKPRIAMGVHHAGMPDGFRELRAARREILAATVAGDASVLWRFGRYLQAGVQAAPAVSQPKMEGVPEWLAAVLWESLTEDGTTWRVAGESVITAPSLALALDASGEDPDLVVDCMLFQPEDADYSFPGILGAVRHMDGARAVLEARPERVAALLATDRADALIYLLEGLMAVEVGPSAWIARLVELACGSRKTVARAAGPLVEKGWPAAETPLRDVAENGKTEERIRALQWLLRLGGDEQRQFVADRAEHDKSKKLRDAIEQALAEQQVAESAPDHPAIELPKREPLARPQPLTARQLEDLDHVGMAWAQVRNQPAGPGVKKTLVAFDAARREGLAQSIGDPDDWRQPPDVWIPGGVGWGATAVDARLVERCTHADWSLIQLVRLCYHLAYQNDVRGVFASIGTLTKLRRAKGADWDLRDLRDAVRSCGFSDKAFLDGLDGWQSPLSAVARWGEDAVWPLLVEHADLIGQRLDVDAPSQEESWHRDDRIETWLDALAGIRHVPAPIASSLWKLALGTGKKFRVAAQRVLSGHAELQSRLKLALKDGQQVVRAAAADWIAEVGIPELVPALEAALAKERGDLPKAAMFTALENSGCDVSRYLDREGLAAEATKLLKKYPKGTEWIEGLQFPEVHWSDSKEAVDPVVLRGWLVKAAKLKRLDPDPLLRRYLGMIPEAERQTLGEFVLQAWLAADIELPASVTDEQRQRWQREAQTWISYYSDKTVEQLISEWERSYLETPIGSATASKGVLAFVAACGGPELAAPAERYIRKWHGHRVHQSKALLTMLAWADDPAATQVVLSIAVRFRTAGIRKEAAGLAEEIAERKGWTMDELADRTLPTAGFDEAGRQELCYRRPAAEGPESEGADPESEELVTRRIELQLLDDLSIRITREDGKVVKSLPAARKDEDEASVKAAKKALSASKKALKQTVQQQAMRLQEAMGTQRAWPVADWKLYLAEHPVVGKLCRRLIWFASAGDELIVFRPLEDGTLTSVDDDEVELPEGCEVRIAHGSVLGDELSQAWQQHLADFEVDALFGQFPTLLAELPAQWEALDRLETRKGWMTTAYKLRGRATKLGYTRGAAADAGWFTTYEKAYPSLGIQAVIEFTGNPLPEEERDVALLALYFTRAIESGGFGAPAADLQLGDIPRVLLDECRSDYATVAAEGPGFAADWEKQSSY